VKMKIVNFAARPFLEWRIIARHALSPLMHNMLLRLLAEEEAKNTKDKRLRYG
jgi:hypothetical protein